MAKVHICLRWSYTVLISVMGIISLLLLGLLASIQGSLQNDAKEYGVSVGFVICYVFLSITLLFTLIGGFGISADKQWALMVFAAGTILRSLFLLFLIFSSLAFRHEMENKPKEVFLRFLHLTRSEESESSFTSEIQNIFHCCGLESYTEWGNDIPESCVCTEGSTNKCTNVSVELQTTMIHSEPCLPVLIQLAKDVLVALTGILLGQTLFTVLPTVLCIAILCQMNKKVETLVLAYSPDAKVNEDLTETTDSHGI
ncbi:tetraspanin-8-like [Nothobranchius furzeri]|uniref:tetraspanin-8-like n=1 Tax=Nothobranchius furzeri TaxID=105023 RepID=UPI00077CE236